MSIVEGAPTLAGRDRVAIVLLAAAGAAFLPGALDRFVFPKLAVLAAGVAVAATADANASLPRPALAGLGFAGLVLVAAALAGRTPLAALIGRPPRYEGVVALPVYLGCLLAGARLLRHDRPPQAARLLLDTLAVAALAIGAIAILEAAGVRPLSSTNSRPGSLLGNASDQGTWALLALGPLAAAALHRRDALHVAGVLAAGAALATSGSRGALAGAVVLAAVITIGAATAGRGRKTFGAIAAGLAALAIAVFALPAERARVTGSSPLAAHTSNGRLLLWGETTSLVADRPLLGVGPSGYLDSIPAYHSRRYERQVGPLNPPDSPHNWILQAAAAGGVPLALLAVALAALTLIEGTRRMLGTRGAERALATGMLAALAGYAVALLFYFTTAGSTPLAALYAGALLATPGTGLRHHRAASRAAAVAFAALTAVLIAAAAAELPLRSAIIDASAGRLAAADSAFRTAHDLRPWDPGVDQTAAHAFAVLASRGVPGAAALGLRWVSSELDAWPHAIGALEDAATLDAAAGDRARARALLATAQRLDPNNPELRAQPHSPG